ncbi:hypothetical protein QAD02_003002, partial [Eretmocerus hayati]
GSTISLRFSGFEPERIQYSPGDHIGIFPRNRSKMVEAILERIASSVDPDVTLELQTQKRVHTPNGILKTWVSHEKLKGLSLRTMISMFLDINSPPTPNLLRYLLSTATEDRDRMRLAFLLN